MPVLGETNLKKVVLPASSSDGDEAWVEISTELSVDLVIESMGFGDPEYKNTPNKEKAIDSVGIMSRVIKKWNFTDRNKNLLEITTENLRKLPFTDLQIISDAIDIDGAVERALLSVEKKSLSSNSSQTNTATPPKKE